MATIIQNLRNKSEQTRRNILHLLTIVTGIVLVCLWVYSLGARVNNPDTQAKAANDLKPFSALKANIVGGYDSIK